MTWPAGSTCWCASITCPASCTTRRATRCAGTSWKPRNPFPNKDESLSPGFFARVRVPIGPLHQALLVSDRALDTEQSQQIVYVVNDKNEVVSRPIRPGELHDGIRAIEDGLKPGERVIVDGLQLVRPGISVQPKLVDMPTSAVGNRESGIGRPGGTAQVARTTP